MDMFVDLFNATLAYNPFKAMFCESKFTGSEIRSMLQSGLFMSMITLCHYWEVWNLIHFSFISLTFIHMLLLILQGPFPNIAPYHLFIFQPLCLLWGIYYMVSVSKEEKNKKRRRTNVRCRTNRSSAITKREFLNFRNIGMQTN